MKKLIIFSALAVLFLIHLENTFAVSVFVPNQTMDSSANWSLTGGTSMSGGVLSTTSSNNVARYNFTAMPKLSENNNNWTCSWDWRYDGGSSPGDRIWDLSEVQSNSAPEPSTRDWDVELSSGNFVLRHIEASAGCEVVLFSSTTGVWHDVTFNVLTNYTIKAFVDGVEKGITCPTTAATTDKNHWRFKSYNNALTSMDNFTCYNGTSTSFPGSDSPPVLSDFNVTNDEGCEVWNTDHGIACNTTSVNPTVSFTTNMNAWCRIGATPTLGALNVNHTTMGESRDCTGAGAGQGGTSHLCTVTPQDEIVYAPSYIYISCLGDNNKENQTSSSGDLNITSTTIESTARASFSAGIENSLVSGYTTYTGQRIYARNSANSQSAGTFDVVVKKLSKIWAFNRINSGDSKANMINITPVFYNLELGNKTSVQIINQTELLINATK